MVKRGKKSVLINYITLALILAGLGIGAGCLARTVQVQEVPGEFQGQRAYRDLEAQLNFGPRHPGTPGHQQIQEWLSEELEAAGWAVEVQHGLQGGLNVSNLIATRERGERYLLLGAHYDTREFADLDPDPGKRQEPVPGANDGASGVAVLLELARVLPPGQDPPIRLVFFDAEDNGRIRDQDWVLGSRYYAGQMEQPPEAVVILDMIGDRDLNIFLEKTSTAWLRAQIWRSAAELGYEEHFIPREKYSILDDHTPFLEAGVPAVDVIDFDYPAWHTTGDTLEQVSGESLQVVGETILRWLETYQPPGE
jgi:hypothetical protein